ncbi:dephospho-CoA kinase [uncultured Cetobacterium sp.]|uniref:dephospho-CoA kinase n=1 Tax=uncultured Cetobacterium sp. TaxID=527638 RepID=UPI0026362039|nr:dephospho-CoA kinase [uncultured Cetobacterium sp.]
MILGLTGNIGSGKSTVSNFLLDMGIKIFDADIIARDILNSEDVIKEVSNIFGNEFITIENIVDKKKLKAEVFTNKKKLEKLNSLIHPKVKLEFIKIRTKYIGKKEIIVFDIPLLFEVKLDKLCDLNVVVDIEPEIQIKRIKERDSLCEELICKIIESQMRREEKNKLADIVIENNGTIDELKYKVNEMIKNIK